MLGPEELAALLVVAMVLGSAEADGAGALLSSAGVPVPLLAVLDMLY